MSVSQIALYGKDTISLAVSSGRAEQNRKIRWQLSPPDSDIFFARKATGVCDI